MIEIVGNPIRERFTSMHTELSMCTGPFLLTLRQEARNASYK
jgi:hypothetical protein